KVFRVGTPEADECEAQKDVRRNPIPVVVPAVEQSKAETEPDPGERNPLRFCIAQKEEERWSCQASEYAPPLIVLYEVVANVVHQNQNDCERLQPVSVV